MAYHDLLNEFIDQIYFTSNQIYTWNPGLIKEYIRLLILDYLTNTAFLKKLVFIGGTNLRLVKGIDHFSEDLDFDCTGMPDHELIKMTDSVILFLQRYGFRAEARDRPNNKLKAFTEIIR